MASEKYISLGIFIALVLVMSVCVGALGVKWVCLSKGGIVEFSKCSSDIDDKVCKTTSCQVCVDEKTDGVYCPSNINDCRKAPKCSPARSTTGDGESSAPTEETIRASLLSPSEGSSFLKGEIQFSYKIEGADKIKKCELMIDGRRVDVNSSAIVEGKNDFSYALEKGDYRWRVSCLNDNNGRINSETWKILLNEAASPQVPVATASSGGGGGGGGSSGGGGSRLTTVKNTTNMTGISNVSVISNETGAENLTIGNESEKERGLFSITGAAIGATLNKNKGLVIGFVFVVIVFAITIYMSRKKKDEFADKMPK